MKTLAEMIAVAALTSTTVIAVADETQPVAPVVPYAMTAPQAGAVVEQHKAFVEQQQAAFQQAMEAHRQFAEQQAEAMRRVIEEQHKMTGETFAVPFAMPEMPSALELPPRPDLASMDRETRRTEMRKYSEQVRQAMREQRDEMRKQMAAQREAAKAEHAKYLEQMGRARPEV